MATQGAYALADVGPGVVGSRETRAPNATARESDARAKLRARKLDTRDLRGKRVLPGENLCAAVSFP